MPQEISPAVADARNLNEIGFPEFTAKLVTDVFDALISANMRQTESYLELLDATAKTLTEFINETKDDISGAMILEFLTEVLPDDEDESGTKVREGGALSDDEAAALNKRLSIEGDENGVAAGGQLDSNALEKIKEAVAKRIAADKYTLLKEMVKMGLLRMVVDNGIIETKLTFSTYSSSFYQEQSRSYNRSSFNVRAKARTGWAISKWVRASASTSYTRMGIRTTKETQQDRSGSKVDIFGRVYLNFRTDYLPLPDQKEE